MPSFITLPTFPLGDMDLAECERLVGCTFPSRQSRSVRLLWGLLNNRDEWGEYTAFRIAFERQRGGAYAAQWEPHSVTDKQGVTRVFQCLYGVLRYFAVTTTTFDCHSYGDGCKIQYEYLKSSLHRLTTACGVESITVNGRDIIDIYDNERSRTQRALASAQGELAQAQRWKQLNAADIEQAEALLVALRARSAEIDVHATALLSDISKMEAAQ